MKFTEQQLSNAHLKVQVFIQKAMELNDFMRKVGQYAGDEDVVLTDTQKDKVFTKYQALKQEVSDKFGDLL